MDPSFEMRIKRADGGTAVASALPNPKIMHYLGLSRIFVLLAAMMFGSQCHHPVPSSAAVEMGSRVVAEADSVVAHELTAAFDRAETAVQDGDLTSLMLFYAQDYNYHGLKRSDVKRIWAEVFSHYKEIHSAHLFTELKIVHAGSLSKAFVTCTGGLYGMDKKSGKPVTIDSWAGEVHYLVKEGTAWRFLGNVGGAVREVPPTSAPHHPLF